MPATIALSRLRNAIKKYRSAKHGGGRLVGSAHAGGLEESVVALLDLVEAGDRSPNRSAAGHEAVQAIQGALTEMPDDYRRAVSLVYIEGHSVAEAASAMGRTDRAIHNLCYKAKARLRDLLGSRSRYLSGG